MAAVNCGLIQDRPSEPARQNIELFLIIRNNQPLFVYLRFFQMMETRATSKNDMPDITNAILQILEE